MDEPLVLVSLQLGEIRTVNYQWIGTVFSLFKEYFGLRLGLHESLPRDVCILDLWNNRIIDPQSKVDEAGIGMGDILILGPRDLLSSLHFGNHEPETEIRQVEGKMEALKEAGRIDNIGTAPQAFSCRLSEEEFQVVLSQATRNMPDAAEGKFGGRKLLSDMIYGMNVLRRRRYNEVIDRLGYALPMQLRDLIHRRILKNELENKPMQWITCNATALHVEPTPVSPTSLVQLVEEGRVEVGEIIVHTQNSSGPARDSSR